MKRQERVAINPRNHWHSENLIMFCPEKKMPGLGSGRFPQGCVVRELWKAGCDNFPLGFLTLPKGFQFLLLYNALFCKFLLFKSVPWQFRTMCFGRIKSLPQFQCTFRSTRKQGTKAQVRKVFDDGNDFWEASVALDLWNGYCLSIKTVLLNYLRILLPLKWLPTNS